MVKKIKSISLIEIIISITISIALFTMLFGVVSKKTIQATTIKSGTLTCYKDVDKNLRMTVVGDGINITRDYMSSCEYQFPKTAKTFKITLIGGGGGGGQAGASYQENTQEFKQNIFDTSSETDGYYIACSNDNCNVTSANPAPTNMNFRFPSEIQSLLSAEVLKRNFILNHPILISTDTNKYLYTIDSVDDITNKGYYLQSGRNETCSEVDEDTGIKTCKGLAYFCIYNSSNVCVSKIQLGKLRGNNQNMLNSLYSKSSYSSSIGVPQDIYTIKKIVNSKVSYGEGGKKGEMKTITSLNLAGQKISIPSANIGNGGAIGTDGGTTSMTNYNISAKGGEKGNVVEKECNITFDKTRLDDSRYQTCAAATIRQNGEKSQYATNKGYGASSYGYGGLCDINSTSSYDTKCPIRYDSNHEKQYAYPSSGVFGSGGGGSDSMIYYDNIGKLTYTIKNTSDINLNYSVKTLIDHNPQIYSSVAGRGAGGAIIIEWE